MIYEVYMRYKQAWKVLKNKLEQDSKSSDSYVQRQALMYLKMMIKIEHEPST